MAAYLELSKVSDRATGEHALAVEVRRGKVIVDAAAEVLEKDGVLERFVWSTLLSLKELSGGKYTYVYHFDAKAEVSKYLKEKTVL
jgi:predicted transcriptional regulator